jgi:Uma2 family endonuclease
MAVAHPPTERARAESAARVPHLENGDHLSRAEFERRYDAMPELKKAELIEGVVYVGSPVRFDVHSQPHGFVVTWLGLYAVATPGVSMGDNATVRMDLDNEPQPDALLRIDRAAGGTSHVDADGYVAGPPELIVEVAASSVAIDRHKKFRVYQRNGAGEYLIWQVLDRRLEWFVLRDGVYVPLAPDDRGAVESPRFPGLRLAQEALLSGDFAAVLAEQQSAVGMPEHQAFVAALAARARSSG